jgi:hypothetical protein
MLVYVDDIIITRTHPHAIHNIVTQLQLEFPLKDLGALSFFLGIQVTKDASGLDVCQTKYITELLQKTHMIKAKPCKTPCISGSKLSKLEGEPLTDPTPYRQIVAALQYCTLIRPKIAYSVNQLCQHMHARQPPIGLQQKGFSGI